MKEHIITLQRMVGDVTDATGYDDATTAAERTALEAAIALMQAVKEQKDNDRSFWHRIIDEELPPPWPLPHHAEATGLTAQQPAMDRKAAIDHFHRLAQQGGES